MGRCACTSAARAATARRSPTTRPRSPWARTTAPGSSRAPRDRPRIDAAGWQTANGAQPERDGERTGRAGAAAGPAERAPAAVLERGAALLRGSDAAAGLAAVDRRRRNELGDE